MQRISNDNVDRMIKAKLTKCEMNLILFLSFYQDEYGRIYGVHYKDVSDKTGMSYQEFYNAKKSLEEKGFIRCEKSNRIDHDITILNNAFLTREDDKKGYINTSHNIFHTKEFYQMKAGAMLLAMKLMKNTYDERGYFLIGVKKFYEKYTQIFGVTKRVLRNYLKQLKEFFSIGIKEGKYYIEPKKIIYRKPSGKTEAECLRQQRTEAVLRRNRIKNATAKESGEICTFFRQYEAIAADKGKRLFFLLDKSIEKSVEQLNRDKKGKKDSFLSLALIHKLLRKELFEETGTSSKPLQDNTGIGQVPGTEGNVKQAAGATRKTRFHNFHQREYDYDELERMLLETQPGEA